MKYVLKYIKEQSAVCRLLFSLHKPKLIHLLYFARLTNVRPPLCTTFIIVLCSFLSHLLTGQNQTIDIANDKFVEITIGPSIIHEKLPEGYDYTPLFFTARFPIHQFNSNKKGRLKIFAEPQFVFNNAPAPFPTTFEFGANLGVQYFLPLSTKIALSASISAGPHYLSLETNMQAKGFIFSDNFEIGYYQFIGKQWGLSLKPRFRHISNAGLQSPNIGIDNLFLMVGIFWRN